MFLWIRNQKQQYLFKICGLNLSKIEKQIHDHYIKISNSGVRVLKVYVFVGQTSKKASKQRNKITQASKETKSLNPETQTQAKQAIKSTNK